MNDISEVILILDLVKQKTRSEQEVATAIRDGLYTTIDGANILTPPEIKVTLFSGTPTVTINGHDLSDDSLHPEVIRTVKMSLLNWLKNSDSITQTSTLNEGAPSKDKNVFAHIIYWLLNGLAVLWITLAVASDNSILQFVQAYFSNFFSEFGIRYVLTILVTLLLIGNPILSLATYFKLLGNSSLTSGKIWSLLFKFQLLQIVLSFICLWMAVTQLNDGLIILFFLVQTLPLLLWAKLTFSFTLLKKKSLLLATFVWVTSLLLLSVYFSILCIFIIPIAMGALVMMFINIYVDFSNAIYLIFWLIGAVVAGFALAMPYIFSQMLYKDFNDLWLKLQTAFGKPLTWLVVSSVVTVVVGSVALGSALPDSSYITQIESYADAKTFEDKQEIAKNLITKEKTLEDAVLIYQNSSNTYPLNRRYGTLANLYKEFLRLDEESSIAIDQVFLSLAYPFVDPTEYYANTTFQYDQQRKASEGFKQLFGYTQGARETELGLTFNDRPRVNLTKRTISGKSINSQQFVEITIDEEYSTNSPNDEEIVYEFSLPIAAVITDLKLGQNLEYKGQIAPKGAANQVYQEQVNRFRDPALLEQVGPNQYRLRVYPIPGTQNENTAATVNQRVAFTYIALATPKGIPLPWYSREDNISTTVASTVRPTLDGKNVSVTSDNKYLIADNNYCTNFQGIATTEGQYLQPISMVIPQVGECGGTKWQPSWNFNQKKIAILVNVSARKDASKVKSNLSDFFGQNQTLLSSNQVALIPFNTQKGSAIELTPQNWRQSIDSLVFFGTEDYRQLPSLIPTGYDQTVIIGNGQPRSMIFSTSSVEPTQMLPITTPLYLVYLDGPPPAMSESVSSYLINNQAKITDSLEEALLSDYISRQIGERAIAIGPYWVYQRPAWNLTLPKTSLEELSSEQAGVQKVITARLIIEWLAGANSQQQITSNGRTQTEIPPLELLDYLHTVATRNGIVTPYSSYIALVNAEQQQRLNQLSRLPDRYSSGNTSARLQPITPGRGFSNSMGMGGITSLSADIQPGIDSGNFSGGSIENSGVSKPNWISIVVLIMLLLGFISVPIIYFLKRKK